uniref:Uncharacterized protein n=1 Tax=Alexandrium catenella TaxID=2925 RepID=A0A7S1PUT4_ALECA
MSTCEHVTVMGFGPACSGDVGKRYYPGNFGGGKGLWHHYSEELALLIRASELGMKAIIPPEARMRITAKTLTVALPTCVNREQARRLD